MCGIGGIVSRNDCVSKRKLIYLQKSILHRGPDDNGLWLSEDMLVGFVHARLSILDLSSAGRQPMLTLDKQYVLTFNGEIYNFKELRNQLQKDFGTSFVSDSDTEVLLQMWAHYGMESIKKLEGMFAFAIWDVRNKRLYLVRDPFGIKPLYFANTNHTIAFASELRALREVCYGNSLSAEGVSCFLQYGSIRAPYTICAGINAIKPGNLLIWNQSDCTQIVEEYWNYGKVLNSVQIRSDITKKESVELVKECLIKRVKAHLVSDVPVGAFLSGGIDSSAIVSLMRQSGHQNISTFSLSFEDNELNESQYAKIVADKFNTRHNELMITGNELLRLRSDFLSKMDQPSVDGFNTWLVSKFAKEQGFKVVTSGIGGDEFFFGYSNIFKTFKNVWRISKHIPSYLSSSFDFLARFECLCNKLHKLNKIGSIIRSKNSLFEAYLVTRQIFTTFDIGLLFKDKNYGKQVAPIKTEPILNDSLFSVSLDRKLAKYDIMCYLESQLLTDSDVYSMANGLELRVPFVDRVLAEVMAEIPLSHFNQRKNMPKSLLVEATGDLPEEIVFRSKKGFTLPMSFLTKNIDLKSMEGPFDRKQLMRFSNFHWSKIWVLFVLTNYMSKENLTI